MGKPFPLFTLPPELRLHIYESFFELLAISEIDDELKHTTVLLYINRQVFDEAANTLARLRADIHGNIIRLAEAEEAKVRKACPRCMTTDEDEAALESIGPRCSLIHLHAMELHERIERTAEKLRAMREFEIERSKWNAHLIE